MSDDAVAGARALAAHRLAAVAERLRDDDAPHATVSVSGRLLRPVAGYAVAAHLGAVDERYWMAALAVQLAHEASLVHDDVIDEASVRRTAPTRSAEAGVARALLDGDHLLAQAYLAAASTTSIAFAAHFARAVERTIAAERLHGERLGQVLGRGEYDAIAAGKSGELIGCALAATPLLTGRRPVAPFHALGRRIGLVYQMADDLLDYCPATPTGKPALGDYAHGRWTWPLEIARDVTFGGWPADAAAALSRPRAEWAGATALRRCLERLEEAFDAVRVAARALLPDDTLLGALLGEWRERVRGAIAREEDHRPSIRRVVAQPSAPPSAALRARVPLEGDAMRYLARHSRSFRLAARFLPQRAVGRVARVYTFCRVTDDLADCPDRIHHPEALLDEWIALARLAYDGHGTGLALVDRTMAEMAHDAVPFLYVTELAEGMRMDLRHTRYASLAELRTYTHRVASVVGLWVAELTGARDRQVLEHAARMGHAMQLTNILRDVGDDWTRGRLYVPIDALHRHGLDVDAIGALYAGERPIDDAYRAMLEELMGIAAAEYRSAFPSIAELPMAVQRSMAVAARMYEGIHDAIRRNGYDNLRRRAVTSASAKVGLTLRGLRDLSRARRARERVRDGVAGGVASAHGVRVLTPAPRPQHG